MVSGLKIIYAGLFLFSSAMMAEAPAVVAPSKVNISENNTTQKVKKPKIAISSVEKVRVLPANKVYSARIDTGATTTSVGIDEMEIFTQDDQDWVKISIDGIVSKHKIIRYAYIKQHGRKSRKRPVIRLRLILGEVSEATEVTLADREKYRFKVLIGRNYLKNNFVVDVSMKKKSHIPMEHKE